MLIDGRFDVAAAPAEVLAHLFDARLMASCLPGCESLEEAGEDRYRAVVAVALAGVKARFDLQVEVTERLADGVYVHQQTIADAKTKMSSRKGQTIDVGQFKELFGLSRKIAIPLLEWFDRAGVTKRTGDVRQVL